MSDFNLRSAIARISDIGLVAAAGELGISRHSLRRRLISSGSYPLSALPANDDFQAPASSDIYWCEAVNIGLWQRDTKDAWSTRSRTIRGEAATESVRVYDPGVAYPPDWTGPRLGWLPRQKPHHKIGVRGVIVTSAQDRTPAHGPFLVNLKALADYWGYELRIGQFTYARDWWHSMVGDVVDRSRRADIDIAPYPVALQPWLTNTRSEVGTDTLHIAEMNILPTAVSPMSGLLTHGKGKSVVYSHVRQSFEMIARSHGEEPKWAATTGACTLPNYIERKAGQKAKFHHVLGAMLVETDANGHVYPSPIHADFETGAFQVYDTRVERGRVTNGHRVAGLVIEPHVEKLDQAVVAATITGSADEISLLDALQPMTVHVHDLIDFSSRNHHNIADPIFRHAVRDERIVDEHRLAGEFLASLKRPDTQVIVVKSNHDEAFDRWLKTTDWRADPHNAELHLAANLEAVRATLACQTFYSLEWSIRRLTPGLDHVRFLHRHDQSSAVEGVQCGYHGHRGPGGTKGSTRGFLRLAAKVAKGHDHTPTIIEGVGSCGTMQVLAADYTLGAPTTWANAHLIIYPGGAMGLAFIHSGRWRASGTRRAVAAQKEAA